MACILLIDDDQLLRRALRIALEKSGHAVVESNDGRAGLTQLKAQPVDLVITDILMPEMEGTETIRAMRKLRPNLPIIAISGGGRGSQDNYLLLAKLFGAAKVFAKPFELEVLCAAVAELLAAGEPKEAGSS